jgi:hypothetical protein
MRIHLAAIWLWALTAWLPLPLMAQGSVPQSLDDLQSCKQQADRPGVVDPPVDLQQHSVLNPALWDQERLKPAFVRDVVLVGGNANFNYTSRSDIDVHLVIERDRLGSPRSLVDEYLTLKKNSWSNSRLIRVTGRQVELFAEDISEERPTGQGVYSLSRQRWLVAPQQVAVDYGDPSLKRQVGRYRRTIACLIQSDASEAAFRALRAELRALRQEGLKRGGEYDRSNLVFKALRNSGDLDAMTRFQQARMDRKLSLE